MTSPIEGMTRAQRVEYYRSRAERELDLFESVGVPADAHAARWGDDKVWRKTRRAKRVYKVAVSLTGQKILPGGRG